jgi:hypothetical protein
MWYYRICRMINMCIFLNYLGAAAVASVEHAGPGILPAETVPRLREDPGGGHQLQVQGLRGLRQGSDGRLRHPRCLLCSGTSWLHSGYIVLRIRDVFIPDPGS